ncbi:DUF3108 domain-containing protein [candidate division KSB1 bacterium]|nr:DUF3108 domain-containing protein [candidate division KSB1 bacterium]MBL7093474.1 DUF3108 domain-containing protein [candidate division KSB1 bacterium]
MNNKSTNLLTSKFPFTSLVFIILFSSINAVHSHQQTKSKIDTTKSSKQDSSKIQQDTLQVTNEDTIHIKYPLPTSQDADADLDSSAIEKDLLEDDSVIKPTAYDTTNKILLPLNLKKTKFAYFDAAQSLDRVIPHNAFKVGEKLTFIIRYGIIKAGSSTMSVPEIVYRNGYECFKIITEARSSNFFSAFFKVRDEVVSYMDKDGLYTWGFEKHLREGNYRSDRYVDYDQVHGWAVTNKKDSLRIPPCVQDILTTFYYIRTRKLEVGKSYFVDNHADNKLYPLEVKVHKKERIEVKAGTFDCIVVEPILRASGIFKSKGRLLVWLTDDERKIPVQMKSKILIGYITAELKKMQGVL